VDWPYIQHPTPYLGTPMTKDFRDRKLIVNEGVEEYDGTGAMDEGAAFAEGPAPLPGIHAAERAAHARAHVPGIRRAVGARARSERDVFRRYKAIRSSEREYLPEAEPGTYGPNACIMTS
jgi:anaerobic magnesium-protoporphyrin IX monomethyl ester cyclase